MPLRIASWNIEGRLSDLAINQRGTPEHILRSIERLNADILFLAEACSITGVVDQTRRGITQLGYHIFEVPYDEGGTVRLKAGVYEPSMMLLSKLPFTHTETVRLGSLRNAIAARVEDPVSGKQLRILGVHLDDRSETLRLKQVPDLIRLIQATNESTVVMGDFNALHGRDLLPSRLLRSLPLRMAAKYILSDIALRAVDMAKGDTLRQLLGEAKLHEADFWHRPTSTPKIRGREWLPSIRLLQIDHIFVSPGLQTRRFTVARDGGSDHRAISAMITLDK